jgi:uncharacterized 2Fe-2S/4Fe-4S cluster protein (DUF4445 family)
LLEAAETAGINLVGPCGGSGKCGKCKVTIVKFPEDIYIPPDPESKKLLSETELKRGERLACTSKVAADVEVELPVWSWELLGDFINLNKGILIEGKIEEQVEKQFPFQPFVKLLPCILPKPTLDDNLSDLERLKRCISKDFGINSNKVKMAHSTIKGLTNVLHENDWKVSTIVAGYEVSDGFEPEVLCILPFSSPEQNKIGCCFGLALDIGTSTIATYLIDLSTGTEIAVASAVNPQVRIGADVISRIRYTMKYPDGNHQLKMLLKEAINNLIQKLCQKTGIDKNRIFETVIVGNTTMLLNLLDISITPLGSAPYTPVFNGNYSAPVSEAGLVVNPNGKIYVGPIVSGFFGADAVGNALVTNMLNGPSGMEMNDMIKLVLDIGTNSEIILGNGKRVLACSAAAGPAFEGGNLRFGIRASPGAISEIMLKNKNIKYSTIAGQAPRGITGSAVVDAISEFLRVDAINSSGSIDDLTARRWLKYPKRVKLKKSQEPTSQCDLILPELKIVDKEDSAFNTAITITQNDVREIQLAKAAIQTGIEILLDEMDLTADDIDLLYLAGAFGNYINPKSAMGIRLIPKIPYYRIIPIGNAAGASAKLLLKSHSARKHANTIAKKIEYIDLATNPDFQDTFINNMRF